MTSCGHSATCSCTLFRTVMDSCCQVLKETKKVFKGQIKSLQNSTVTTNSPCKPDSLTFQQLHSPAVDVTAIRLPRLPWWNRRTTNKQYPSKEYCVWSVFVSLYVLGSTCVQEVSEGRQNTITNRIVFSQSNFSLWQQTTNHQWLGRRLKLVTKRLLKKYRILQYTMW